ncbi:MAG: hydroxymethylbilane synthase, partial [Gammaproteobacteria bacterium]|nr:hydroxymethylbilane synthase [Gammaproteobacteria bacterium]
MSSIRIATRNSPLALWQANFVKQKLLEEHPELAVEIIGMTTEGDKLLDSKLAKIGGKGLFLKELEASLLTNETDIAVHSMKDVPIALPDGLEIPVFCEREDPRDAFVSNEYQNLYALPKDARIGTSSLRRISQLKSAFPTLQFVELRGNVNTRLGKLDDGDFDAIILAAAGLIRLGLVDRIKQYITPELCLPAVGQGIVGIECRSDDQPTKALIKSLNNRESELYIAAERAMNAELQGGCQVPVAGYAEVVKGKIRMRGMVGKVDGSNCLISNMFGDTLTRSAAEQLGKRVALHLLEQGAAKILKLVTDLPTAQKPSDKPVVVLTRQARYLGNMAEILQKLHYQPVAIQTMEIEPIINEKLSTLCRNLDRFTDIIFVSRNAVEIGLAMFKQENVSIPDSVQVMAVGAESAKQLYKHGIEAMFPDHGTGADALLSVKKLADLSGHNILIFRGSQGLTWPAVEMTKRGATVEHADIYSQHMPSDGHAKFKRLFEEHDRIDGVLLHSAHSATNFIKMVRDDLDKFAATTLVVGSERVGVVARTLGWPHEIRWAKSPSNKHMIM